MLLIFPSPRFVHNQGKLTVANDVRLYVTQEHLLDGQLFVYFWNTVDKQFFPNTNEQKPGDLFSSALIWIRRQNEFSLNLMNFIVCAKQHAF